MQAWRDNVPLQGGLGGEETDRGGSRQEIGGVDEYPQRDQEPPV